MSGLLIVLATTALAAPALQDGRQVAAEPDPALRDMAAGEEPAGAAQPPLPGQPFRQHSLEVTLLTGVWLPRMVGTTALGGNPIRVNDEFDLNGNEATLNVELTIRKDEIWDLWFGGFTFSTDVSAAFGGGTQTFGSLVLNNGDAYTASLDMTSVAAELSVALWRPYADGHTRAMGNRNRTWDGQYIIDLRFSPQFGMRYVDVDQSVTTAGGTEKTGGEWLAVYAGMMLELNCRPEDRIPGLALFQLQASFAAGPALGGDGGSMWQVRAGINVQLTETFGVMIAYRLVELNADNGPYTLNGGLQGLFLAGSFRF